MLNINGGEPVMPDPTSARELIAEQDAEDASEADVALIAYMLNVGEDPNQVLLFVISGLQRMHTRVYRC